MIKKKENNFNMHLTLTFKIKKERKQFQHARNFNF